MQSTVLCPPEIPRLLLMRWEAIEFWERNLCERDRVSLGDVRKAIDALKIVLDGWRRSAPAATTEADVAAGLEACKAAFASVSKVSRKVGNDLRSLSSERSQSQLWRGRHIAHLLDGIEDESTAASDAAMKEGHPALRPDARNSCAIALRS